MLAVARASCAGVGTSLRCGRRASAAACTGSSSSVQQQLTAARSRLSAGPGRRALLAMPPKTSPNMDRAVHLVRRARPPHLLAAPQRSHGQRQRRRRRHSAHVRLLESAPLKRAGARVWAPGGRRRAQGAPHDRVGQGRAPGGTARPNRRIVRGAGEVTMNLVPACDTMERVHVARVREIVAQRAGGVGTVPYGQCERGGTLGEPPPGVTRASV